MKTNPALKIAALAVAAALAVPLAASARNRHHPDPEDVFAGAFIASVVAPLVVGAAVASSVRVESAPRVVYCETPPPPPPYYYAYPPPPPPPQYYGYPPPPCYGQRPMHHHRRSPPQPYGY